MILLLLLQGIGDYVMTFKMKWMAGAERGPCARLPNSASHSNGCESRQTISRQAFNTALLLRIELFHGLELSWFSVTEWIQIWKETSEKRRLRVKSEVVK